ncbi:adhesin [Jeotgalibacillus haloalkalitolerans]|uniref:Adhesin n=1 Tax=Jeotgalibacillus haloalkalitolerans TaxID=3104292 RepID=A0ABU5KQN0_9BACL|nr:adhesin [Jeotgalibacillus sp. HH7-29]MDZ5713562.1 adhesin [Jeotgalibacillus sp. HH7-29]
MNITPGAVSFLKSVVDEKGAEGIRFYKAGEGCCGPSFGLGLDPAQENDQIHQFDGLKLAVDGQLEGSIDAITLDVEETPEGPQIVMLGGNAC